MELAKTTLRISEHASTAVALVGPEGTMERATALFLDCTGEADAFLAAHALAIETVIGREASHAAATLAWTSLDIAAVTDADGQRFGLLTIARPAYE